MSNRVLGLVELEDRAVPTTFPVTNLDDFGAGTLRQAVLDANAAPGPDEIVFAGTGAAGTITLFGHLELTGPVTVAGPGAAALTVSGNNLSRIFTVLAPIGTPVTISGLTLTAGNGNNGGNGGAIFNNAANLTVADCVIMGNSAGRGGGISGAQANGTFTLRNSAVAGNTAVVGGGVCGDSGSTALIEGSTISDNRATTAGAGGFY